MVDDRPLKVTRTQYDAWTGVYTIVAAVFAYVVSAYMHSYIAVAGSASVQGVAAAIVVSVIVISSRNAVRSRRVRQSRRRDIPN